MTNELFNNHKYLVKQHLGISIATEQILSCDDFIHSYNKAKTAAPIDTEFKFRTEEINYIMEELDNNRAVLLCGAAGIGKTRLALECCHRFAEKNNYKLFCIRNNNQPIYDDLHLFFRASDNYMILIDDANELTQLETIINYFNKKKESNYKIILTVRNYAAQNVSTILKPIINIKVQKIFPLKDNEIEELLKNEFGITNPIFLDRIVKIAEGNARIAFLAGKISVDSNSLESIKDVTDIYSSYYGKFFSTIDLTDKNLFSAAAIAAFFGAIHMEHLNEIEDIISICNMTVDDFKESLYQLHKDEIIDIYKEKAVRFADQCLSNYLLYYVFVEKKLIKLSDMIRYTFKVNKTQTIASMNILINLFITQDNQDFLFSEIKDLWNDLSKEDPVFFWEYVKVFYMANPTEALILVKEKIENTPPANLQIENLKIDDRNNSINDDILTILGGFANTDDLATALELYFFYFKKRPDLINQFYYTAINNFGIDKESYRFDFYSSKKYIEKLIEESNNWQDKYVCRLFVLIAKHFLKLHFDGTESKRQNGFVWYRFELVNSSGVESYREMIWNGLIEMYSQNIEVENIEDILYNYGNPNSDKNKEVIENDYRFIIKILSIFQNKGSYFFCKIIDNLQQTYKNMGIMPDNEFNSYLGSEAFMLYKTFGRIDYNELNFLERDDVLAKKVEEYVSSRTKQEFYNIIDFFCSSKIDLSYHNKALNYAFEYALKNKDYYLDALKYYYIGIREQYPLNSYMQISLMFETYSDSEIWAILSLAPESIINTWQYCYFEMLPEKYIDEQHLLAWFDFLKDDSDKYISSSGYRNLLFLKKFHDIDNEVIIKSCKEILSKRRYSEYIVKIYIELLLNPLPKSVVETIEIFKDHYELLSEIYIFHLSTRRQEDYHGVLFKAIYEKYPKILDLLFEKWEKDDSYITHDDAMKLSKLFEMDDYETIFDNIMDRIISCEKGKLLFREDELKSIVSIDNLDEQYRNRPDNWIKHFIIDYHEDASKMYMISEAILDFNEEKRIEYIKLFLSYNKDIDTFKCLQLLTYSMSWSGSEVPVIQKRVDFLNKLLPVLNGLDYLNHKKWLEKEIEHMKRYMVDVEINEIIKGL